MILKDIIVLDFYIGFSCPIVFIGMTKFANKKVLYMEHYSGDNKYIAVVLLNKEYDLLIANEISVVSVLKAAGKEVYLVDYESRVHYILDDYDEKISNFKLRKDL